MGNDALTRRMSMYGGNRDNIGWNLVGMDGSPHAWLPRAVGNQP